MDNPRTTLCLSRPFKSFTATPPEVASIIFTEISFSPETSILLQIIQIIHMTIGIMPESARKREGSLSVLAPSGKHNVTPTNKKSIRRESPWDLLTYPPPFWGRKETIRFPEKTA